MIQAAIHFLDVRSETLKARARACGEADQLGAAAAACPVVRLQPHGAGQRQQQQQQQQEQANQPADLRRSASCPEPSPPPPAISLAVPAPPAALPSPLWVAATQLPDSAAPGPCLPHHPLSAMVPATGSPLPRTRSALPGTCSGHAAHAAPNTATSSPAAGSLLAARGSLALPCSPALPPHAAGTYQGLSLPAGAPMAPQIPASLLLAASAITAGLGAPLAPPTALAASMPAATHSPAALGNSFEGLPHPSGQPCGSHAGMATVGGRKRASLPMLGAEVHADSGGGPPPETTLLQHAPADSGALPYAATAGAPCAAAAGSAGGGVDTVRGTLLAAWFEPPGVLAAEADTSPRPRKRQAHGVCHGASAASDGRLVVAGPEGPVTGNVAGESLPPGQCTAIGAAWLAHTSPSP